MTSTRRPGPPLSGAVRRTGFTARPFGKRSVLFSRGGMAVILRYRGMVTVLGAVLVLGAVGAYSLTLGDYLVSLPELFAILSGSNTDPLGRYFLLEVRPPRLVAAVLVGVASGVAGALSQTVTGNPLGSPDILGFTSGAATGAVLAIVVGGADVVLAGPAAAAGALVTLALVVLLSRRTEDGLPMTRLVLVGVGVGAGLAGLNRFLIARAPLDQGMAAALWEAGSFNSILWPRLIGPAVAIGLCMGLCVPVQRGLTVIGLGDDIARGIGVKPARVRIVAIVLSVLLVAAATSIAGPIAFVAMAAPHAARVLARADRPGLVASAAVGAATVVAADVIGRKAVPVGEIPVGLVTGVVGGLYLVVLLARTWRKGRW